MSTISWNSSKIRATRRPRSAPSSPGSSSRRSSVARRSSGRWLASKPNDSLAVSGSTLTVGLIRSPANTRRRSSAFSLREATSSWIARASFSASLASVGVVIRSTEADQHAPAHEVLRDAPHQRRLAIAARREHDDVLAVADVGPQLGDLLLAIGEGIVERQRAVAKGIGVRVHGNTVADDDPYLEQHYCALGKCRHRTRAPRPRVATRPPSPRAALHADGRAGRRRGGRAARPRCASQAHRRRASRRRPLAVMRTTERLRSTSSRVRSTSPSRSRSSMTATTCAGSRPHSPASTACDRGSSESSTASVKYSRPLRPISSSGPLRAAQHLVAELVHQQCRAIGDPSGQPCRSPAGALAMTDMISV